MDLKSKRYNTYYEFIKGHISPKNDTSVVITNTSLKGGRYHIPDKEYAEFLRLYYRDIVSKNKDEYLTEKQLEKNGPIVVDCDFRYDYEVTTKQYNKQHIVDLIYLYLKKLKEIYQFVDDKNFPVYVFEKPNVNRLKDKNLTKDGIHMIIGIQSDRATQVLLRQEILKDIGEEWKNLKLKNSWNDVFDEGISKGGTNWQLYGSRKPDHEK